MPKKHQKTNGGVKTKSNNGVKSKQKPKFKFKCQLCGNCCGTEIITITLPDLERWAADNTIYRILHLLKFTEVDNKPILFLKKDDDGYCNLFHRDNKKCTIYESRPLFCRAYPLGFNGDEYYLKSKDCKGLNKGTMTKEQLKSIRDDAFEEHIANRQIDRILPILYGVIFNKLIADSKAFMEKLSDAEQNNSEIGTEPEKGDKAKKTE